jgi:tRNA delta(2)-isopentenylpyrophosphate transferase
MGGVIRNFVSRRDRPHRRSYQMAMTTSRITLLAGPTASGKSALALKWAQTSGAVILNADSQQLYADLRVLSARPSPEDEARVEHRLYGIADGAEAWSVGRWSRAVLKNWVCLGTGRPSS